MKTKTLLGGAVVGLCIGVGLSSLYWSRELLQSYVMTIDANGRTYAQAEKTLSELENKHQAAAKPAHAE